MTKPICAVRHCTFQVRSFRRRGRACPTPAGHWPAEKGDGKPSPYIARRYRRIGGETHGNGAPHRSTNPEGVELGLAPRWSGWGSTPPGSIGFFDGGFLSVGYSHG